MPRYMGKPDIGIMSHPSMPVAAAKTRCHYPDYYALIGWVRIGYNLDSQWFSELCVYCCFHRGSSSFHKLPLLFLV